MKFSELDLNKTYSYADYVKWTFEEVVEIIKGRVYRMAAPLYNRQQTSSNVHTVFKNYLRGKNCRTLSAPFDVRLTKSQAHNKSDADIFTVVQPDICVVCDIDKIDRRGCIGAPDLIVEILSKGTVERDVKYKFEVYEESGVLEYWIASIEDCTVSVFRLANGSFQADHRPYVKGDIIRVGIFDDLEVSVEDIFEGLLEFKN